jgi:putative hydrolase of the HAD superfamily
MPTQPTHALLFDLGGVLVDIDFGRALAAWAPYSSLSVEDLARRFAFDLQYQRHERGEINASEYLDHLASVLELSATRAQIQSGWNAIFVGEITETRMMIESVRQTIPCYAFTNTNAAHMAAWSVLYPGVVGSFDRIFASHEIGLRKPDHAAFRHVAEAIGVAAGEIVFFDDLLDNVRAATEAGLRAVHVRSPEDVRHALREIGLAC